MTNPAEKIRQVVENKDIVWFDGHVWEVVVYEESVDLVRSNDFGETVCETFLDFENFYPHIISRHE